MNNLDTSPLPSDIAVRLRAVEHVYAGGTRALTPTDIDVRQGELVSLIGPSGCGKSTLLRIVAGLEAPTGGHVARAAGRRLAYVFQQPTLMPWSRVHENVRLPLDLGGVPRHEADRRVTAALAQVGLAEFARSRPRELSGGMQMRVSIARALVTDPQLLLMDEPFGALDEITRDRLDRELLALRAQRHLTVLFVTHSLHEAVFLSSRVLVMSPRPGALAGALEIDEPFPRPDDFRVSARFAQLCAWLGEMLVAAGSPR